MKALISPIEPRETGYRVAEVHPTGFEVADPLYWVDCPDTTGADTHWFDPTTNGFALVPSMVQPTAAPAQPTTNGTQTL